jgi:hypothetical protein
LSKLGLLGLSETAESVQIFSFTLRERKAVGPYRGCEVMSERAISSFPSFLSPPLSFTSNSERPFNKILFWCVTDFLYLAFSAHATASVCA